jgi:arylsulfatase
MRRNLILTAICSAGLIVLAVVLVLFSGRRPFDTAAEKPELPVVRLGNTEAPVLRCDFGVVRDDEIADLWALASQPCSLEAGWSAPAWRGVSASSSGSVLDLFVDRADWTRFVMRVKKSPAWMGGGTIEVRLNGRLLGSTEIPSGWRDIDYPVPTALLRKGVNRFRFDVADDDAMPDQKPGIGRPNHAFQLQKIALTVTEESHDLRAAEVRAIMSLPPVDATPGEAQPTDKGQIQAARPAPAPGDARAPRPDIVLIILDAARPDHFSCYGYDRATTPFIDRLAEESQVFSNAFALVPNTRRSIPTMVTGFSFINHRVVTNESMLSEEAITLAEHLQIAGYRTACFTATPNNSRSLGTEQGYDEFYELWKEAPIDTSIDPHYLAKRVVEWMEANDAPQPLHLQLHFVPPHAPYTPAPEFDLFSDPAYEGPFDGFPKKLVKSGKGPRAPSAEDLAQMIGRYDGNLRAADDAVGRILLALRRRPNWSNTVVLVTSDHGEAFLEHHHMGHNKAVYDEMLRVPFILRLPAEFETEETDLDRLATLADIVPTMLAAAGLRSRAELDGENLLASPTPDESAMGRYFVGRTAHGRPTRCLRSARWKIVISRTGKGELYDLRKDPHEQKNLRFAERSLYLELGELLVRRFTTDPVLPERYRETDVSEPDREMLEALGYVD